LHQGRGGSECDAARLSTERWPDGLEAGRLRVGGFGAQPIGIDGFGAERLGRFGAKRFEWQRVPAQTGEQLEPAVRRRIISSGSRTIS
jgi:hypothetical protein